MSITNLRLVTPRWMVLHSILLPLLIQYPLSKLSTLGLGGVSVSVPRTGGRDCIMASGSLNFYSLPPESTVCSQSVYQRRKDIINSTLTWFRVNNNGSFRFCLEWMQWYFHRSVVQTLKTELIGWSPWNARTSTHFRINVISKKY